MLNISTLPPLSLYIHLPWCIRKCPYCDFNSHQHDKQGLPEQAYIDALLADLKNDAHYVSGRKLSSIFFGGGTPSLFSASAIADILAGVEKYVPLASDCEITLEANPGTDLQTRLAGFFNAGVNRLSLGVQSFDDDMLKKLGRIHDSGAAKNAIEYAKSAGFSNINLDIMHGLPGQTVTQALNDLTTALATNPAHLSWYQLTLEPNTVFYKKPPQLPDENTLADIEQEGKQLLATAGFNQYEISAFAHQSGQPCQHNRNYWQYADNLGIGAGAHGKLTDLNQQQVVRICKKRQPDSYLQSIDKVASLSVINEANRLFEFMLNALRLFEPCSVELFEQRTGLSKQQLESSLHKAIAKQLAWYDGQQFAPTELGYRYLNDLTALFLPNE